MTNTAVITGAASGIGKVIAERFMAAGYRLAVCDANADAINTFQKAHPDALAFHADVRDEEVMVNFFAAVEARFSSLDVVIANAGTGGPAGNIEDLDFEEWKACLAVNLDGAFLTCRWAAKLFKEQKSGLLLLTSSTAGLFGYPQRSPYAVAKWGIIGLMKTLAMELGPCGARVNALCPGAVEGDRMDRVVRAEAEASGDSEEEVRARYVKGVSLKTWVRADDIADMALFLASPQALKISGQAMAVDGHTETLAP